MSDVPKSRSSVRNFFPSSSSSSFSSELSDVPQSGSSIQNLRSRPSRSRTLTFFLDKKSSSFDILSEDDTAKKEGANIQKGRGSKIQRRRDAFKRTRKRRVNKR